MDLTILIAVVVVAFAAGHISGIWSIFWLAIRLSSQIVAQTEMD